MTILGFGTCSQCKKFRNLSQVVDDLGGKGGRKVCNECWTHWGEGGVVLSNSIRVSAANQEEPKKPTFIVPQH